MQKHVKVVTIVYSKNDHKDIILGSPIKIIKMTTHLSDGIATHVRRPKFSIF